MDVKKEKFGKGILMFRFGKREAVRGSGLLEC